MVRRGRDGQRRKVRTEDGKSASDWSHPQAVPRAQLPPGNATVASGDADVTKRLAASTASRVVVSEGSSTADDSISRHVRAVLLGIPRSRRVMPGARSGPGDSRHPRCRNRSPRCGARTRSGEPCRSTAMSNGRCRMHGGEHRPAHRSVTRTPNSKNGCFRRRLAEW